MKSTVRQKCKFKEAKCHKCGKIGHLARVCRSLPQASRPYRQPTKKSSHQTNVLSNDEDTYTLFTVMQPATQPLSATFKLNGVDLTMDIDTGASISIISEQTFKELWGQDCHPALQRCGIRLRTYTGELLPIKGEIQVDVHYKDQINTLPLIVAEGNGPSLVGRNWLSSITMDWTELCNNHCCYSLSLQGILDQHAEVFQTLSAASNLEAVIHIEPEAKPRFFKPRTVPYAIKPKVEMELKRLQQLGVIEPVTTAEWAAPIVPVMKKDGSVRICGDYKLTVNQVATTNIYPLPKIEDLLATLAGGKKFSKLDLANAYLQIPLQENSKKLVAINTHKGLFRYNRLPFGVLAAPSIFQRTMEVLLQGLAGVCVYLDDILITGKTEAEHLHNLSAILERLKNAEMKLNSSKSAFMLGEVEYLVHKITLQGLQPTDEKVRAILKAPAPTNVSQLKSFLGMLNYYGKFLPSLSTCLAPLYSLLQKNTKWTWHQEQEKAFQKAKDLLTAAPVLTHYDPDKPLILTCDASPWGVGAVLSQLLEDGCEHPVAYASRSLAPAEKKYSQIDKEGLAIIFGVQHFNRYLLSRSFTIHSDHKPLQYLFSDKKGIPVMASARIQRWALTLGANNYKVQYKPGKDISHADVLSRIPLSNCPNEVPTPGELVLMLEHLQTSPVWAHQIKQWTDKDPVLSKVRKLVLQGWPNHVEEELRPYFRRKIELSIQDGCIMWGSHVVVPPPPVEANSLICYTRVIRALPE